MVQVSISSPLHGAEGVGSHTCILMCAVATSVSWQPMQAIRPGIVFHVPLVVAAGWQDSQLRTSCGYVIRQSRPGMLSSWSTVSVGYTRFAPLWIEWTRFEIGFVLPPVAHVRTASVSPDA